MSEGDRERIERLAKVLSSISPGQLYWVERVLSVFKCPSRFVRGDSDLITPEILTDFGDALKIHHAFSVEPFSKDKFEFVLQHILNSHGVEAELAPRGNPGHDLTLCAQRVSLKTQANEGIKPGEIWISKFMELGGGVWGSDPDDLVGLRRQFLRHLERYDRIFTLRTLSRSPDWSYELVEIPKALFERAAFGRLEMRTNSSQSPKPGYCYVSDERGAPAFELYFDGGGERKLQVKKLQKSACVVHASWAFSLPRH